MKEENKHPAEQISEEAKKSIGTDINFIVRRYGVDEKVAKDIYRIGYESGWEDALTTSGAIRFHRLLDSNGKPV